MAEKLLTQPPLVIVGEVPGKYGSYHDGYEIISKTASKKKTIYSIKGAGHVDLCDKPKYVEEAVSKLVAFYKENL